MLLLMCSVSVTRLTVLADPTLKRRKRLAVTAVERPVVCAVIALDSVQCRVLVMIGEHLEGILTEQDVVRRVVAEQRDPNTVTLADVMTINPDTITPDDLALTGLRMMEDGCYRHLPVIEDGGTTVRLILGTAYGEVAPATMFSTYT